MRPYNEARGFAYASPAVSHSQPPATAEIRSAFGADHILPASESSITCVKCSAEYLANSPSGFPSYPSPDTESLLVFARTLAHDSVMPDIVLVAACLPIIAFLVFFFGDKFRRLWIQRSWRQHSAFYGDMDSPGHLRHKTLSTWFLERNATAIVASTVRQGDTTANRFMERIRAVLVSGRVRMWENVPDNDCPVIPPSDISAEQDVPSPRSPIGNGPPISGDGEIKIESTRCDLHPLYVLCPTVIEILFPGSTAPRKIRAWCCTKQGCDRHYLAECGYFAFVTGQDPTVRGLDGKPACSIHKGNYMALVKTDGHFAWACLNLGCAQTVPYQEP